MKWRKHRNGEWVPEDRLRAAVVGAAICIPMSLVICGVVTEYVPGILGLTINFASFFMNGVGVSNLFRLSIRLLNGCAGGFGDDTGGRV